MRRMINWLHHALRKKATKFLRVLYFSLRTISLTLYRALKFPLELKQDLNVQKDTLYCIWDLNISPNSYDYVAHVFHCEYQRILRQLKYIHFVFHKNNGYVQKNESFSNWRLNQILLPITDLIPSKSGITVDLNGCSTVQFISSIPKENLFPKKYTITHPKTIYAIPGFSFENDKKDLISREDLDKIIPKPTLKAPQDAIDYLEGWVNHSDKKLIVITLRESNSLPARNSLVEEWIKVGNFLKKSNYRVVFVRDTSKAITDQISFTNLGFEEFQAASFNVSIRMALYERAYLNLSVNNGPSCLLLMNKNTKFIIFKFIADSKGGADKEFFKRVGFPVGSQVNCCNTHQKIIWDVDNYENIINEFKQMVNLIKNI